MGWLVSVGAVRKEGRRFRLTEFGGELAASTLVVRQAEGEGGEEAEWGSVKEEVLRTQHETTHPEKFEKAVVKAFELLGFGSNILGVQGEPDAILRAPWREGEFRIVLDAKTAEEGRYVPEGRVNPWALREFRERYEADAVLVVGPRFAGGRLRKVAKEEGIVLLETPVLAQVLELAARGPVGPGDLIPIIASKSGGCITQSDLSPLEDKVSRFASFASLAAEVCRQIWSLREEGERTRVSDLCWALNREYGEKEIESTLDFLGKLGIVRRGETGEYSLTINPRWIPHYLERAARIMSGR